MPENLFCDIVNNVSIEIDNTTYSIINNVIANNMWIPYVLNVMCRIERETEYNIIDGITRK